MNNFNIIKSRLDNGLNTQFYIFLNDITFRAVYSPKNTNGLIRCIYKDGEIIECDTNTFLNDIQKYQLKVNKKRLSNTWVISE